MSSRGEACRGVGGDSQGYGVTDAKVKVKAEQGREGCDGGGQGEVLFSQFLEDKSFWCEAS